VQLKDEPHREDGVTTEVEEVFVEQDGHVNVGEDGLPDPPDTACSMDVSF
jgi:hypothetical protein